MGWIPNRVVALQSEDEWNVFSFSCASCGPSSLQFGKGLRTAEKGTSREIVCMCAYVRVRQRQTDRHTDRQREAQSKNSRLLKSTTCTAHALFSNTSQTNEQICSLCLCRFCRVSAHPPAAKFTTVENATRMHEAPDNTGSSWSLSLTFADIRVFYV